MDLELFPTPGLGDASYLLVSGDEAVVVDPQRDAWRFSRAARARGVTVRGVLETHVHNDYVSGAHELRDDWGAELYLPAGGRYAFPHTAMADGDELTVGDLRLTALHTPGHTPEHLSWLVSSGDSPVAVFTGGSLLVGSAGRTDLLGPSFTDGLTRDQFASLRRLGTLPDDVQVLPTHGAGSFCVSAMPDTRPTSTVGAERAGNAALGAADLEEFTEEIGTDLMLHPAYYAAMAPINRAGAPVLRGLPRVPALTADEVAGGGPGWVVDARDRETFAAGHIPGAVNIELNSGFGSYVGWMLPFDSPVTLVLPDPQESSLAEALTQLIRIGWRRVSGHLDGGFPAWARDGRPVRSYPSASLQELCAAVTAGEPMTLLDVRQPLEWGWGTLPGSTAIFVADLPQRLAEIPTDRPAWVICSNGHRAAIAASLLDGAGVPVRLVGSGGVSEFRLHCPPVPAAAGR
ncbi:MAG: MBL fold metallo-hydrolase [Actinomycetes bacterium]